MVDLLNFFLELLDESECVALRIGLAGAHSIADIIFVVGDVPHSVASS